MQKIIIRVFNYFYKCLLWKKNINMGRDVVVNGKTHIEMSSSSTLTIGCSVVLNSRNKGYHINMHSECKFVANYPGGEIKIGENSRIHGVCINAKKKVIIGKNCLIAANCQIMDNNGHKTNIENPEKRLTERDEAKAVEICDNVWIGCNCVILPGTKIGEGSVVMAGSTVGGVFPERCIIGGVPAVIIKRD